LKVASAQPGVRSPISSARRAFCSGFARDLNNVAALDTIGPRLARLQQMLDDASLLWLAEAYVPTLELHGVAKVRAKKD
jgi:hypothetical protein